jgi:hypothetical protein
MDAAERKRRPRSSLVEQALGPLDGLVNNAGPGESSWP